MIVFMRRLATLMTPVVVVAAACSDLRSGARRLAEATPDSLPALRVDSLPFRYPPALYIEGVQDNVTLRLYVDEFGRPVPESTRVEEHAKHAAFDSSAMEGAKDLVFRPAYRGGKAIPYPVFFPIRFRVPNGPPLPGDTLPPGR
jgi:TonB family protein